jgi:hypothetical protein
MPLLFISMSFFKKIGRSIGSAFKKAPSVISSIFKKAPGIISGGLSKVGDVLGKVADIGGSIASNPLVEAGASALLGPEAGIGLAGLGKGLSYLKKGSQIAKGASSIAGARNVSDAIGGIQKLKDIAGVAGPTFA